MSEYSGTKFSVVDFIYFSRDKEEGIIDLIHINRCT